MSKYKLGDEVRLECIGKITEIYLTNEGPMYALNSTITDKGVIARRVKESELYPLPEPDRTINTASPNGDEGDM